MRCQSYAPCCLQQERSLALGKYQSDPGFILLIRFRDHAPQVALIVCHDPERPRHGVWRQQDGDILKSAWAQILTGAHCAQQLPTCSRVSCVEGDRHLTPDNQATTVPDTHRDLDLLTCGGLPD